MLGRYFKKIYRQEKKNGLNGNVNNFSVGQDTIDTSNVVDIHKKKSPEMFCKTVILKNFSKFIGKRM